METMWFHTRTCLRVMVVKGNQELDFLMKSSWPEGPTQDQKT